MKLKPKKGAKVNQAQLRGKNREPKEITQTCAAKVPTMSAALLAGKCRKTVEVSAAAVIAAAYKNPKRFAAQLRLISPKSEKIVVTHLKVRATPKTKTEDRIQLQKI